MSNFLPAEEPVDIKQILLEPNQYTQKHFGFVRGMVLQNNDPERRGRVKLYIPTFAPQVYDKWLTEKDRAGDYKDKKFRFPVGNNLYKDKSWLGQISDELKKILPWAEQASGLIGAGTSGLHIFNNPDRPTTISDANTPDRVPGSSGGSQNVDSVGEKGANKYEPDDPSCDLYDGFRSFAEDKMPEVNVFAKTYKPSSYSNRTKGFFTVPNVGATVWVFFENGDLSSPVYFAYSYDKSDWQSIYDVTTTDTESNGPDYPGCFENSKNTSNEPDYKKGKIVLSAKGGAIEITDTDEFEQIKITQAGGSFIQLSNKAAVHYADANEQRLVRQHQFETVNLTKNLRVKKNYNIGIDESCWTRIGFWNTDAYESWKQQNDVIADTRARFAIKRSNALVAPFEFVKPPSSIRQQRKGLFAPNPILQEATPVVDSPPIQTVYQQMPVASSEAGNQSHTLETATEPVQSNDSHQTLLSLSPFEFINAAGPIGSNNYDGNGDASASTQDGIWEPDSDYLNISALETLQAEKMREFELNFGNGGDSISEITRHKYEVVGAVYNDSQSVRVDPIGRTGVNEILISPSGAFASQKPSPVVERVANDGNFPCGNYSIVVNNSFAITAAAGGISLQTIGCFDISGSQVVIAGAQELLMSSAGDIRIASGARFELSADIINFRQKQGKQVSIESSLGVKNNLIIAGGAYIEGELCINHITAPVEIQETETMRLYGRSNYLNPYLPTGELRIIGWAKDNDGGGDEYLPVYCINPQTMQPGDPDTIMCEPHSHNFKNLPLTLKTNNEAVRTAASAMNKGSNQVAASPVRNELKSIS